MSDHRIDISELYQWRLPPEDAAPKVVPHYPDADDDGDKSSAIFWLGAVIIAVIVGASAWFLFGWLAGVVAVYAVIALAAWLMGRRK